jgi:hypothetical protein
MMRKTAIYAKTVLVLKDPYTDNGPVEERGRYLGPSYKVCTNLILQGKGGVVRVCDIETKYPYCLCFINVHIRKEPVGIPALPA